MLPSKKVPDRQAPILPVPESRDAIDDETIRERFLDDVEVKSLSVGENLEQGGDPYNSTGQFAALQANQKK